MLGALAPKVNGSLISPLTGLKNLVGAMAPGGAPPAEKATLLAGILSGLTGGGGVRGWPLTWCRAGGHLDCWPL